MAIYLGTKKVKEVYLGTSKVGKIYLGNDLVYESAKWQLVWSGSRIMKENAYSNDYPDTPDFNNRNDFGLIEGVPTQVSASLHGFGNFGCLGNVDYDVIEEIIANPSGDSSNLPWDACFSGSKALYLKGPYLYQTDYICLSGFDTGVVIVKEIWQKF